MLRQIIQKLLFLAVALMVVSLALRSTHPIHGFAGPSRAQQPRQRAIHGPVRAPHILQPKLFEFLYGSAVLLKLGKMHGGSARNSAFPAQAKRFLAYALRLAPLFGGLALIIEGSGVRRKRGVLLLLEDDQQRLKSEPKPSHLAFSFRAIAA